MFVDVLEHLWEGSAHQWFLLWVDMGDMETFLCPGLGWGLIRVSASPVVSSLGVLDIFGHPKYFREGKGLLQLIHTQKCWDGTREQILFPLQVRRATAFDPRHKKGVGQGKDPQAPSLGDSAMDSALALPPEQAFAICQGKGTTHTLVLLLSWCTPDFKCSLSLLNREIQTTSDIPFLENYFGKDDSFTALLNKRSNIFQHSLRMYVTRS